MGKFRSYFSKNNTLIDKNETNNSQNPVCEISYGTLNKIVSRYIFDIDLEQLKKRIEQGFISNTQIGKHILHLTNTIAVRDDLLGSKREFDNIDRANSFELELFNISEEWDEGSGYDFIYNDESYPQIPKGVSNWYEKKTTIPWENEGAYLSGSTQIIGKQRFEKGNEDIEIDITDYINSLLFTGSTGFTGTTHGLGIKFVDNLEDLETLNRQAVAFYAKKTHTFFEPYVETTFNNTVLDDRHHFFQDKDNDLYLYVNVNGDASNVDVNSVTILDYEENELDILSGDSIIQISKGIYKVSYNISSDIYPDAIMFSDVWDVSINGRNKRIEKEFYLISSDQYFDFSLRTQINLDNYYFTYTGIQEAEKIQRGHVRRIDVNVKELYPVQDNNLPLNVEYRIFITQTDHHQHNIVPYTKINRTVKGFEFLLDTSWLIPQDYYIELRLISGGMDTVKKPLNFTIISEV